jgi:hypothetical protein
MYSMSIYGIINMVVSILLWYKGYRYEKGISEYGMVC